MSNEDVFYVYLYLRKANSVNGAVGTPYYVGKGFGNRAYVKHVNVPTPKDTDRIIILANYMNEPDAMQAEMLLIRMYGRLDLNEGCLRNRTDGGEGCSGARYSEETRKKVSLCKLGPNNPMYGTKASAETRAKMSKAHKGWKMPEEHKQRLREAFTGVPLSPEHRAKLSLVRKGKKHSPERRARRVGQFSGPKHPRWQENPSKRTLQKRESVKRIAARKALAQQQ